MAGSRDGGRTRARLGVELLEDRTTPAALTTGFTETAVATGVPGGAAMEFAPNGDLWVVEQGGAVKRFRPGSTAADVVANLAQLGLRSEGERGLLGIAFHPGYDTNKFVYFYYTSSDAPNPHNRVSRFKVNDSNAANYSLVDTAANPALLDEHVILDLDPLSGASNHNGGAIHFGPDGRLYVAVGDNANGANAQSLSNRHGKILRINAGGGIPADNPTSFPGVSGTTSGANRAIWALGLRNPFTFAFGPDGRMFVNDVGQNTWEEINVGGPGRNFGWPVTEGDFDPAAFPAFTRPLYSYSHGSGSFQGFAITGGAFYPTGTSQFPASFAGDYFFADFVKDWIHVVNADGTGVREFATDAGSAVDLRVGADGSLYYLARDMGTVFRVDFTGSGAPAISAQPTGATFTEGQDAILTVRASGAAPLSYVWQKLIGGDWTDLANGNGAAGARSASLRLTAVDEADAGQYRVVVTNSLGSAESDAAVLGVTANQAPSAEIGITSGLVNGKFVAGKSIAFTATAADPEEGVLPGRSLTWRVEYITSIDSGSPAVRPFVPAFTGRGGSFTPATTGPYTLPDVAYRITLTARDSLGQTTTRTLDVLPNVANLTLRTTVPGLSLTLDGQPTTDGTVFPSVVGFKRRIGGPTTQSAGGFPYTFRNWSDGGAITHAVATPAADATFVAKYAFVTRVNFQPAAAPLPALHITDSGAVFADRGNGYSYGWNADIGRVVFDRNATNSPDQRYDTFAATQRAFNPDATWEIAVPNGTYRVRVVAGDPLTSDGMYRYDVEGVRSLTGRPTDVNRWLEATVEVTVTDGRLTITNGTGARNNKLAFLYVVGV